MRILFFFSKLPLDDDFLWHFKRHFNSLLNSSFEYSRSTDIRVTFVKKFRTFCYFSMTNILESSSTKLSYAYKELPITYSIRFWLFLISDIFSIQSCLFVLYHLLFIKSARQILCNHSIIVLLLINLIFNCVNVPLVIHYYRLNGNWQITRPFTQIWQFFHFALFATQTILFAWCCIERYFIVLRAIQK